MFACLLNWQADLHKLKVALDIEHATIKASHENGQQFKAWATELLATTEPWDFPDHAAWCKKHGYPVPPEPLSTTKPIDTPWLRSYDELIKIEEE